MNVNEATVFYILLMTSFLKISNASYINCSASLSAVNADTLDQDSVPQKSSRAVRSSKRLKVKESSNPEKQDTKKVTRNSAGKVLDGATSTKKTVYELVDELSGKSKQSITCNPEPNDIGSKVDKSITSTDASNPNVHDSTSNNGSEPEITKSGLCDSPDFTDQMKERANKLKRQWLLKKTSDEKPDSSNPEFKAPFPVRALSPIPSLGTDTGSEYFLFHMHFLTHLVLHSILSLQICRHSSHREEDK